MQPNTAAFPINQTLLQQQSNLTLARITVETARDNGEKIASALGGNHLNFSNILSAEVEKQRRLQHLKESPQEAMKKAQPL